MLCRNTREVGVVNQSLYLVEVFEDSKRYLEVVGCECAGWVQVSSTWTPEAVR